MFLRRSTISSNASRQVWKFTSKWYDRSNLKSLTFRKKSNAGRASLAGRIICWTKQSILRRIKLINVNYNFNAKEPSFISTFKITPFSNKLLSLVIFGSGAMTYFPASEFTKIFDIAFSQFNKNLKHLESRSAHFAVIKYAPLFRKVSNIALLPGKNAQYVRSSGCYAKIIKADSQNHTALVKLPSGVKKFFSLYAMLTIGAVALKLKRKLRNTRSGFWRSFGLKSKVRGVAMNPVDHPHGGRTKSIKYPRTPWGHTTKRK